MIERKKHIPQRTCIVCHVIHDKHDLIRVVKTPEQTIMIDEKGKVPGRGAYLCHQPECWQKAIDRDLSAALLKQHCRRKI